MFRPTCSHKQSPSRCRAQLPTHGSRGLAGGDYHDDDDDDDGDQDDDGDNDHGDNNCDHDDGRGKNKNEEESPDS